MKVSHSIFEGTPEEFSQVSHLFGESNVVKETRPVEEPTAVHTAVAPTGEAKTFVNTEQAQHILSRRPLSKPMVAVLDELYRSGKRRIGSTRLKEVAGFKDTQSADRFRGLMGAFGRRVAHDVGSEPYFFDLKWNYDTSECEYTLPHSVRDALVRCGMVRAGGQGQKA